MMQLGLLIRSIMPGLQLPAPASVVGNADPVVQQMLAVLAPAADELVRRYPYTRRLVDGKWIKPLAAPPTNVATLDTDDILFDTPVIRAAVKWRWQEANGLDYAEAFRQCEEALSRVASEHMRATRDRVDL
ncbi:hypothetical protein NDN16_15600 [Aureimonas altamirensis]|uniref:hypothetical protein n=1 Tax=Aureimonas altamirensis TaxID=370622 RepID=UPI002036A9F5|nr:hypothetical protein [Aureimonas altamirensis]MCM2505095.1 hypothetical protein [Aureimonas altamirensis]